ncbi:MAG TPA: type VI secretion system ATPase TssH [Chiayiivirga sp.]|nr:type VI secretion system ATPase TssH [Chiayiivirga sp.]
MNQPLKIQRAVIAKRLDPTCYKALEAAFGFARLRGNAQVDLLHWLHQLLDSARSDLDVITRNSSRLRDDLDRALLEELDRLPKGSERVSDFSAGIDEAMEAGWVVGSGYCGVARIRSAHLLAGILRDTSLLRSLGAVGTVLRKLSVDEVVAMIPTLPADLPESGASVALGDATVAAGNETGAPTDQSALGKYTQDLTAAAKEGKIDAVIGRDNEIRQIIDILQRRRQNNPILTGEPGVGKTAVVEGLARAIVQGEVPPMLKDVRLLSLDLGALQAGASMKGEFEARLKAVIEAVQQSPQPIILFVDEAHTLVGAGGAAGTGDAANLLKPALARGTLRTIAATTWAEYKKYFEKDPALVRRFQVISVDEPRIEAGVRMLHGLRPAMEGHHKVEVLDEAVRAAVELSSRYIPSRQLPDKAISLLDTACARVAVGLHAEPAAVTEARRAVESLELELRLLDKRVRLGEVLDERIAEVKANLTQAQNELATLTDKWTREVELTGAIADLRATLTADPASEASDEEGRVVALNELQQKQKALDQLHDAGSVLVDPYVSANVVASVVSDWTGVPLGRMVRDEATTLAHLADLLGERVVGQAQAHVQLANRIRVGKAGLQDPTRPIGVFLMAGPSGVGKTETALALAEILYGGEQNLISINMSEFQEAHTVSTLKGAPPGYVGYGEGGRLTEAVRRKPYSVVLLDEVEKAHPDVHEIFFQVFDKGAMEDSEGRRIDFRNCVILLTTNVGSDELIEFATAAQRPENVGVEDVIMGPLREVFPDALLGRMKLVPFMPLGREVLDAIVKRRLADLQRRAKHNYGVDVVFSDSLYAWVSEQARPTVFGARLVNTIVTDRVAPRLAEALMQGATLARLELDIGSDGGVEIKTDA